MKILFRLLLIVATCLSAAANTYTGNFHGALTGDATGATNTLGAALPPDTNSLINAAQAAAIAKGNGGTNSIGNLGGVLSGASTNAGFSNVGTNAIKAIVGTNGITGTAGGVLSGLWTNTAFSDSGTNAIKAMWPGSTNTSSVPLGNLSLRNINSQVYPSSGSYQTMTNWDEMVLTNGISGNLVTGTLTPTNSGYYTLSGSIHMQNGAGWSGQPQLGLTTNGTSSGLVAYAELDASGLGDITLNISPTTKWLNAGAQLNLIFTIQSSSGSPVITEGSLHIEGIPSGGTGPQGPAGAPGSGAVYSFLPTDFSVTSGTNVAVSHATNADNATTARTATNIVAGGNIFTNVILYSGTSTNYNALVLIGAGNFAVNGTYYNNGANLYTNASSYVIVTNATNPRVQVTNTVDGTTNYATPAGFGGFPSQLNTLGSSPNAAAPMPFINWFITPSGPTGTVTVFVPTVPSQYAGDPHVFYVSMNGNDLAGSGGGAAFRTLHGAAYAAAETGGRNTILMGPGLFDGTEDTVLGGGEMPPFTTIIGAGGGNDLIAAGTVITNNLIVNVDTVVKDVTVYNYLKAGYQPGAGLFDVGSLVDYNNMPYPFANYKAVSGILPANSGIQLFHVVVDGNVDGLYLNVANRVYAKECVFGSAWDSLALFHAIFGQFTFVNCEFLANFDLFTVTNALGSASGNWTNGFTGTGIALSGTSNTYTFQNCYIVSSNSPATTNQANIGGTTETNGSYGIKFYTSGTSWLHIYNCIFRTGNTNLSGQSGTIWNPQNGVYDGTWNDGISLVSTLPFTGTGSGLTNISPGSLANDGTQVPAGTLTVAGYTNDVNSIAYLMFLEPGNNLRFKTRDARSLTNIQPANLAAGTEPATVTNTGPLIFTNLTGTLITAFPTNTIAGWVQVKLLFGTTNLFLPLCYTNY